MRVYVCVLRVLCVCVCVCGLDSHSQGMRSAKCSSPMPLTIVPSALAEISRTRGFASTSTCFGGDEDVCLCVRLHIYERPHVHYS